MRIIGGTSRGRRLAGPPGRKVRPTADPVKEALFNILADRIRQARFLDLFAGTGAVGIEALSRGASRVTFVESHAGTRRLLRANLRRCGLEARADVQASTVSRFLMQAAGDPYDIIFLDPPYHTEKGMGVLPSLGGSVIMHPDGVLVIEHFHKTHLEDRIGPLTRTKTYRYGDTLLSMYRHSPREDSP
jgi:16S rRNA (guanine(966)-N(2))-methyltransferase RsmD